MHRLIFLLFVSIMFTACQSKQNGNSVEAPSQTVEMEQTVAEPDPQSLYADACAEISQTRMFEGSKRVDILKSVGGLSSQPAVKANELMTDTLEAVSSLVGPAELLAREFGSDVRANLAGQITEACVDEVIYLSDNACMLSVLGAMELNDSVDGKGESPALLELTMRMARLLFKQCDEELTSTVLP